MELGERQAAIIYGWQQKQHVLGQTTQLSQVVADLDSEALALTKEASGNSHAESVSEVWGKMLQRNLYNCKSPHMYSMKDKGFMQISMNLFFLCKLSHLPSSHHSHKVLF